jgi:hypothetical protein
MVCKPINQINFKLEEMYDAIVWVFMIVRQASVFDANIFGHHISQLKHLISGNIPHPERFVQMVCISKEKNHCRKLSRSLPQMFMGIYDPHAILQNLS